MYIEQCTVCCARFACVSVFRKRDGAIGMPLCVRAYLFMCCIRILHYCSLCKHKRISVPIADIDTSSQMFAPKLDVNFWHYAKNFPEEKKVRRKNVYVCSMEQYVPCKIMYIRTYRISFVHNICMYNKLHKEVAHTLAAK